MAFEDVWKLALTGAAGLISKWLLKQRKPFVKWVKELIEVNNELKKVKTELHLERELRQSFFRIHRMSIVMYNENLELEWVNGSLLESTGLDDTEDAYRLGILLYIPTEYHNKIKNHGNILLERKSVIKWEVTLPDKSKGQCRVVPVYGEDEKLIKVLGILVLL